MQTSQQKQTFKTLSGINTQFWFSCNYNLKPIAALKRLARLGRQSLSSGLKETSPRKLLPTVWLMLLTMENRNPANHIPIEFHDKQLGKSFLETQAELDDAA